MLHLTYEHRPKWNKNKTKSQNAVSRSDPLQGSDKNICVTVHSEQKKNQYLELQNCKASFVMQFQDVQLPGQKWT